MDAIEATGVTAIDREFLLAKPSEASEIETE
jgi:hypothetical protein